MNAFQVKCYLLPDNKHINSTTVNQATEIRRFALTYESSGIYNQLIDKIQTVYGALLPNKDDIKTYWQDEENDFVCFSTDSEAHYAIDLQTAIKISKQPETSQNNLFKVYILRKTGPVTDEPQVHPGVSCDGCKGSISGVRYKCATCPDYDLCSGCKEKDLHKEHSFVRLDKPCKRRCPYPGRQRGNWHRNRPNLQDFLPTVNNPEHLKHVGEYLKKFLDPFGIDVDYYVDSFNKSSHGEQVPKPDERNIPKTDEISVPKQDEKKEESVLVDIPQEATSGSFEQIPLIKATSLTDPTPTPTAPVKDELIDFGTPKSSPFEFAASALKSVIAKSNEEEFNMIDIEKELKYINCVDQLKLMGYADEGSWLTRLVIAKNGNLNAVLDALQPSK